MRATLVSLLVVGLFLGAVFVPWVTIPVSASPHPCKPPACTPGNAVTVSNVLVNANSRSGSEARVTWSTNPTTACSTVWWYGPDYQLIGSQTVGCGVHEYLITAGLDVMHRVYNLFVSASAIGYSSGASSMVYFRTTDISVDNALEDYGWLPASSMGTCLATGKYLNYHVFARMAGDVANDATTRNGKDVTPHTVYTRLEAIGPEGCDPSGTYGGIEELMIALYVYDDTQPGKWVANPTTGEFWMDTLSVNPVDSTSFRTGQVTYSYGAGGGYPGSDFGVSATYTPGDISNYIAPKLNLPIDGGGFYAGYAYVKWNPSRTSSLDASFIMLIHDKYSQAHQLDSLRFKVVFVFHVAEAWLNPICSIWCPRIWQYEKEWVQSITLGDGVNQAVGSADQYTEVQSGVESFPW